VLGVRPEAMGMANAGRFEGMGNSITAKVEVVEPLGEKMDLYLSVTGQGRIISRVDARRDISPGDQIGMYLDMRKIHIFQPGEIGLNLTSQLVDKPA
ncbi:MAG TPA: TOBE domain-containing protein, partial [Phycisphaerae bacterium]|nr:TOBE domain-containing protein [Phycisphaerae bacterium]